MHERQAGVHSVWPENLDGFFNSFFVCLIGCIVFFSWNYHASQSWPRARRRYAAAQPELWRPAPAPPSPRSTSRRTSSRHGHERQWPSSPPPLLPSNLTPTGSHRPWPAGRSAPVERHCAANNFSHGRRATSGLDAAALRHVARYSEHTHRSTVCHGGRAATCRRAWRTAEQHAARATGDRLPCLLPMQATAGRTPALLALTPEQCPS